MKHFLSIVILINIASCSIHKNDLNINLSDVNKTKTVEITNINNNENITLTSLATSTTTPAFTTTLQSSIEKIGGCNKTFITNTVLWGNVPVISPNGEKIVYICEDNYFICLINSDGTGFSKLNHTTHPRSSPQWSPNGDMIAIVEAHAYHDLKNYISDIYLITPDGTIVKKVTDNPTWTGNDLLEVQWSPDGNKLLFSSGINMVSDKADIYVINTDGTNLLRLTFPPAQQYSPRWSPDGKYLAYLSIYKSNTYLVIRGTSIDYPINKQLLIREQSDTITEISWSPNGRYIAYSSERNGKENIFIYDILEEKERRLTDDTHSDDPNWSRDGTKILFSSYHEGKREIYTIDITNNTIVAQVDNKSEYIIFNQFWSFNNTGIYFFISEGINSSYDLWYTELIDKCK